MQPVYPMPDLPEQWRAVPGFEGHFEVSTLGRVRSLTRGIMGADGIEQIHQGQLLACALNHNGYQSVCLRKHAGRRHGRLVHRLVLQAFVGPCPPKHEGAHWDGNRGNPRLSNLRWATHAENREDRHRHGTYYDGEKVNSAKLTWPQVREIRRIGRAQTLATLAKRFGVGQMAISCVLRFRTWKNDPEG